MVSRTWKAPRVGLLAIGAVVLALGACGGSKGPSASGAGAAGGSSSGGPPGELSVWTQGASRKIQPTTAPGAGTSIDVASCRKAYASWQLVVRGKGGTLSQVKVAAHADLSDGNGHTLAKDNVTFFREHYVDLTGLMSNTGTQPVPASSPTADGNIPDALIPLVDPYTGNDAGQPFDVGADVNQPVFVDVYVPAGTTAGTYTGSIDVTHVTASGGATASVPISVVVWNVDLPDMGSVRTHFKMSINALPEYHAGISQCSGGSCYLAVNPTSRALIKRYEELAHSHRIDTGQQLIDAPVNGCTAPSASDWAAYDAAMGPYMSGTYFSDGIPSTHLDAPFIPGQNYGVDGSCGPAARKPDQSAYAALAQAWATHLKAQGWFARSIAYAYDEPPASAFADIAQASAWLQQGDPGWKANVLDTTSPNAMSASVLNPAIGIYTVALPWYGDWAGNAPYYGRAEWPGLFQQGIQLWFYSANAVLAPYPTMSTQTLDGLEPLIQLWGSWYEGATGFLYWDIAAWDDKDPWGVENKWYLPGDGVLLYPGNHDGTLAPAGSPSDVSIDGPIPSYRLKMLRQGLQDWALFDAAAQSGLGAMVKQQVATVYTQLGGCKTCTLPSSGFYWKTDQAAIDAARAAVAMALAP
jgi:hypothetical protein